MIAIGNVQAKIKVYIENKPPLAPYNSLNSCLPLKENDIATIAQEAGNHWRKIFNVYAKLAFELNPQHFNTWQQLREQTLLQQDSAQCLVFSKPSICQSPVEITIVMGKTYAASLGLAERCYWLTPHFAINESLKLIICPYFDYRQLSNEKITQLVGLIKPLQ